MHLRARPVTTKSASTAGGFVPTVRPPGSMIGGTTPVSASDVVEASLSLAALQPARRASIPRQVAFLMGASQCSARALRRAAEAPDFAAPRDDPGVSSPV